MNRIHLTIILIILLLLLSIARGHIVASIMGQQPNESKSMSFDESDENRIEAVECSSQALVSGRESRWQKI
jgi:hypothetical protein